MRRRAFLRNTGAISAAVLLPTIVPSQALGAVIRPVNIVVEKVVPYATLVIRVPDISEVAEYTPGNSGEVMWIKPDGTKVDLVDEAKRANVLTSPHLIVGPTKAKTNSERMMQALDWFRASGVFSAGFR